MEFKDESDGSMGSGVFGIPTDLQLWPAPMPDVQAAESTSLLCSVDEPVDWQTNSGGNVDGNHDNHDMAGMPTDLLPALTEAQNKRTPKSSLLSIAEEHEFEAPSDFSSDQLRDLLNLTDDRETETALRHPFDGGGSNNNTSSMLHGCVQHGADDATRSILSLLNGGRASFSSGGGSMWGDPEHSRGWR